MRKIDFGGGQQTDHRINCITDQGFLKDMRKSGSELEYSLADLVDDISGNAPLRGMLIPLVTDEGDVGSKGLS
ncbi:hypothetical protein E2C01_009532 [Portunus trituberculatus]|uniref:Uncharacterized protein n=1 Tax=Portunus trituberculatus TaxID=210409 RepID=A0A5B7D603_PORTR|nr:hypothetical protein [Portunus trituberculatus]